MACEIEDNTRWAKPQENQMLVTEDSQKVLHNSNSKIIAKSTTFTVNNWLRDNAKDNKALKELESRGAAVWISTDGNFFFRPKNDNGAIKKLEPTKMKTVLSNMLDRENINIFTASKDEMIDIKRNELLMCEERFSPFVDSEFYQKDGMWYRTAFRPSRYLQIEQKPDIYRHPEKILWLIKHLCNYNEEYFRWTLNWIACFFKTLKKSQVSLVLKGEQGTGKGILFGDILSQLFGKEFCVVVDDDRLGSNFKNWLSDKLFFNLNEIAHDMRGRKNVKNFIKMLVTDRSIQVEKKYENAAETEIFGNVLITSNENYPLEVEPSDRRYSVFMTGKSLKKTGVDTAQLIEDIQSELEFFAYYLRTYDCDEKLYHTALDTPEKQAMIEGTTDRFTLFVRAIANKDLDYFSILEEEQNHLYNNLVGDFKKNRIRQSDIKPIFEAIFEEDIPSKTLFKNLRAVEPLLFPSDRRLMQKSNGEHYYKL